MLLLLRWLACTLSPGADSAPPDEPESANAWNICYAHELLGDANGSYSLDGAFQGGCFGKMTLWCDDGIRGAAELACDGSLSSLMLDLSGVQSGSALGGSVVITANDDTDAVVADWTGHVEPDFQVIGGFETSDEPIRGGYELSGAFAVRFPPPL